MLKCSVKGPWCCIAVVRADLKISGGSENSFAVRVMMFSFLKIEDEGRVVPSSPDRALTGAFLQAQQLPLPTQTLTEAATVLLKQFGDFTGGFLAGPVPLHFADVGPGRYRDRPRLDHALDRHVVSFTAGATRCVGQKIDFIAIGQCREHRHLQTHFRPKAGHHQLLLAGLFHPVHDPPVFPTVEGGTVERGLLGEDVLDSLIRFCRSAKAVVRRVGTSKIFAALATAVALVMTWDASCERSVSS